MATDDRDGDDYFEALAGRGGADGPGARALRKALLARQRTLDEAERATTADLDADALDRMEAVRRRLVAAGAWSQSAGGPAPSTRPSGSGGAIERLRRWLAGGWPRPLALALSVLAVGIVTFEWFAPDPTDPSQVIRGGEAVIRVADPAARSQALAAALEQAGAQVVVVQVAADEWALQVSVTDAAKGPAVRQLLNAAGYTLEGPPPYELTVRRQ